MTKTYTIGEFAIYTSIQPIIHQFITLRLKNLGHTRPGISTASDIGEYIPPKKVMELEINSSLILSSVNYEISLETQKIFHSEKSLRNQDMIRWDIHSVIFTTLVEGMISYISMTP